MALWKNCHTRIKCQMLLSIILSWNKSNIWIKWLGRLSNVFRIWQGFMESNFLDIMLISYFGGLPIRYKWYSQTKACLWQDWSLSKKKALPTESLCTETANFGPASFHNHVSQFLNKVMKQLFEINLSKNRMDAEF